MASRLVEKPKFSICQKSQTLRLELCTEVLPTTTIFWIQP